jgi:hypothetical protein
VRDAGPEGPIDFVGDVHGCADELEALLETLGWEHDGRSFRHASAFAVFVGDVVDRGPAVRRSLALVRAMVEAGRAELLLGNHEYNLIGHFEPAHPDSDRQTLRRHTPRAVANLRATLDAYADAPEALADDVAWLRRRPLCLELPSVRAVHACWDEARIAPLRERPEGFVLTDADWLACSLPGHPVRRTVDRLLNGTVQTLPEGVTFRDTHGIERRQVRTKFWGPRSGRDRLGELVIDRRELRRELLEVPVAATGGEGRVAYGEGERPLFFGHYWFRGRPRPVRANLACLDYSAVLGGSLVAYRFRGESTLSADGFVAVPARNRSSAASA